MEIKEERYQNGTLLSSRWRGMELGLFVGVPESQRDISAEVSRVGQSLDIVVRKLPQDEWEPAPEHVMEGFTARIKAIEQEQQSNPVEPPPNAEGVHQIVLAFMKKAFVRFVEASLN